jgi:lysophospholipase L1-like esterase
MKIPHNSSILFIGDSITDAGRGASGEVSPWEPQFGLGTGYVSQLYGWLLATYPEANLRIINKGISGHTVRDLAARWENDVIALRPDVLCVMIGINDVWRQFDSPRRPDIAVGLAEYSDTLTKLLASTKTTSVYLATPYFIEPNPHDLMRQRMDEYGQSVKKIAVSSHAVLVDTQAAFDSVMKHLHPATLAWDRIHPGPAGHMVIARAFLQAFGCL